MVLVFESLEAEKLNMLVDLFSHPIHTKNLVQSIKKTIL